MTETEHCAPAPLPVNETNGILLELVKTYPVPRDFYKVYKESEKFIFDEVKEEKLFGKHKYEPEQTSVMITYQP